MVGLGQSACEVQRGRRIAHRAELSHDLLVASTRPREHLRLYCLVYGDVSSAALGTVVGWQTWAKWGRVDSAQDDRDDANCDSASWSDTWSTYETGYGAYVEPFVIYDDGPTWVLPGEKLQGSLLSRMLFWDGVRK